MLAVLRVDHQFIIFLLEETADLTLVVVQAIRYLVQLGAEVRDLLAGTI
jgi:hypothetical protein